eukprot:Hpha_TRINITY_DN16743_c0_g2::TRINITY_DN16743_c0_g2_i10::g.78847::m.78847
MPSSATAKRSRAPRCAVWKICSFTSWDRARIRRILGDHPSVDQCVELAEAMKECSLYAFDPFGKLIAQVAASSRNNTIQIVFVINNQHCYPVLNRDLLLQTIRTKRLELQKYTVDIAYDDYDTLVSEEFDPGVEYKKT